MSLSMWWWGVVEIKIERMVLSEGKKETIKYWNTNHLNLEKGSRTTDCTIPFGLYSLRIRRVSN